MTDTTVNTATAKIETLDADQMKTRQYFAHDAIATEGVSYLSKLMAGTSGLEQHFSFDPANIVIPDGFDLLIQPLQKRPDAGGEGMQLTGFIAGFVPSYAMAVEDEKAASAIHDAYLDILARKLKAVVNGAEDGAPPIFPSKVEQFFERVSRGEGLVGFNAIAKSAVKQLKEQGLSKLDTNTLRNILMSEAFAKARYPKIPQQAWLAIMDMMAATAKGAGLDNTIYATWKANRSETSFDDVENIDLSGLGLTAEVK